MKNRIHFCNQGHLSEIDGYMELGMEEEARRIIRATFDKHEISEEEFHACVFALLQSERLETWKNLVKTAYRRLSKPVNDQVRSAMLNYYFSVGQAARECGPHRATHRGADPRPARIAGPAVRRVVRLRKGSRPGVGDRPDRPRSALRRGREPCELNRCSLPSKQGEPAR